ncbi:universal stress protein [Nonomuraea ceibae]|uniref:universal stress protein n=1 Tax=Nonomuraea ceibae TaxID=1935170 RepID=UPI001C5F2F2E|nr:universal stress protein [Nonomuraea ceibae]
MSNMIVVGVDGWKSSYAALDWAADDAARRGLGVRIVHVREPWAVEHPLNAASDQQTLTEWCEALVRVAAERVQVRQPGLAVATSVVTGAVAERLRDASRDADTVVLGSRGLGRLAGRALGSVGLALAGRVSGPVVIVREVAPVAFDEVVAGFDGSAGAEAALAYALAQAQIRGARLRVIYAVQAPHPGGHRSTPAGPTAQEVAERLAPWRQKYPDVELTETVVAGAPPVILARASRQADLVVVGSRGLGALASVVLGSVSHGLLLRAHCPVVVIPPSGTRS